MREHWLYVAALVCGAQFMAERFADASTNVCRESLSFAQYQICSDDNVSNKFNEFRNLSDKNFDLSQDKNKQLAWKNEFIEKIYSCSHNNCVLEKIAEGTAILRGRLSLLDVPKDQKIAETPANTTRVTSTKLRGLTLGASIEELKKNIS